MLSQVWNRLWDRKSNRQRLQKFTKHQRTQLLLENLEERRVMTTGIESFVANGVLYGYGTSGNDVIQFRFENNQISVPGVQIKNASGTMVNSIARNEVNYVIAVGDSGDDRIEMLEVAGNPALPLVAFGSQGNDTIIGGSADDVILGMDGFDTLLGMGGNDKLIAGQYESSLGTAVSPNTAVYESIYGGEGDDVMYGSVGTDVFFGQGGNDTLYGFEGNDYLYAGYGIDTIWCGSGDDRAAGDEGDDLIYGEDGNDWLVGCVDGDGTETGIDRIYGGRGDDTLWGGAGNDRLVGEWGNDTIYGEDGNDWLVGCVDGDGTETGIDKIYGGRGDDTLWGGAGNDRLVGELGNDAIYGEDGNDWLVGCVDGDGREAGIDKIYGGRGDDTLWGGAGNDRLVGEWGNDTIYGEDGNDWLVGCVDGDGSETGIDRIYGGRGNDTLWGGAGNDRLVGEWGNDTIYGEDGNDWLVGCVDGDGSETGIDKIYGGKGNDTLWGGAGNDWLYGEQGNDTLNGELGNDYVDGGADNDIATVDNRFDVLRGAETVSIQNIPGGSPQNDNWSCGPNSGSRFLNWYGVNISYEQLRALTQIDGDLVSLAGMGTRPTVLLDLLRRFRPETQLETRVDVNYAGGALNRVLDILGTGKPVLALVNAGGYSSVPLAGTVPTGLHWIVLTGLNKTNSTISFTDTSGVAKTWTFNEFYSRWNWSSSGALGGALTGTLNTAERTILY